MYKSIVKKKTDTRFALKKNENLHIKSISLDSLTVLINGNLDQNRARNTEVAA